MRTVCLWQAFALVLLTGAWLMAGLVRDIVFPAMFGWCFLAPFIVPILWDKFPRVSCNALAFSAATGVLFALAFLLEIRSSIHTESALLRLLVVLMVMFFVAILSVLAIGAAITVVVDPEIATWDGVRKLKAPNAQWIFDSIILQGGTFVAHVWLGRKNSEAIFVVIAGTLGLLWMAYVAPQSHVTCAPTPSPADSGQSVT